jgi:hypothetical protein
MKDHESAFPVFDATRLNSDGSFCTDFACTDQGISAQKYAAIHLRVPQSGDENLNRMIRASRRAEFAGQALEGNVFGDNVHDRKALATSCFTVADAMLAEWEKEVGK